MMDDENHSIKGTAVKEMEEECGIIVNAKELIDLTQLAFEDSPLSGVPLSQGGCDEVMRLLYLEKSATREELENMKNRLTGLRQEGEVITLRVVPYEHVWKVSGDSKAIM
jgi:ADP-sugar diphosphatase